MANSTEMTISMKLHCRRLWVNQCYDAVFAQNQPWSVAMGSS